MCFIQKGVPVVLKEHRSTSSHHKDSLGKHQTAAYDHLSPWLRDAMGKYQPSNWLGLTWSALWLPTSLFCASGYWATTLPTMLVKWFSTWCLSRNCDVFLTSEYVHACNTDLRYCIPCAPRTCLNGIDCPSFCRFMLEISGSKRVWVCLLLTTNVGRKVQVFEIGNLQYPQAVIATFLAKPEAFADWVSKRSGFLVGETVWFGPSWFSRWVFSSRLVGFPSKSEPSSREAGAHESAYGPYHEILSCWFLPLINHYQMSLRLMGTA